MISIHIEQRGADLFWAVVEIGFPACRRETLTRLSFDEIVRDVYDAAFRMSGWPDAAKNISVGDGPAFTAPPISYNRPGVYTIGGDDDPAVIARRGGPALKEEPKADPALAEEQEAELARRQFAQIQAAAKRHGEMLEKALAAEKPKRGRPPKQKEMTDPYSHGGEFIPAPTRESINTEAEKPTGPLYDGGGEYKPA